MNTATNLIDDLRILEAPHPWYYWPLWIGAAVLSAGFVVYWLRARQARDQAISTAVAAQAHEDALAALEKARALIQPGNSKAFAIEVSSIVRRYLESRFSILAPRRSTEEFLEEARSSPKLEARYQELLAEFLSSCDFLKFARGVAEVPELETLHQAAVRFVSETKFQEATATVPESEAAR